MCRRPLTQLLEAPGPGVREELSKETGALEAALGRLIVFLKLYLQISEEIQGILSHLPPYLVKLVQVGGQNLKVKHQFSKYTYEVGTGGQKGIMFSNLRTPTGKIKIADA